MSESTRRSAVGMALVLAVLAGVLLLYQYVWRDAGNPAPPRPQGQVPVDAVSQPLVVYCAHDILYAEQLLGAFTEKTGIKVSVRFDSEATKSLGLTELLIREKDSPRCDVFWNNLWLGTADLKQRGVLEPYKGEGWSRMPEQFRDADGYFAGFAARLRVWIVNTDAIALPEDEAAAQAMIAARFEQGDLSRLAKAQPMFGTTLSHYSVLWDMWGGDKLKAWHRDMHQRGIIEKGGNATVKNLVAEGVCDLGMTDTDDFFVAKDDGKPVAMLPIRVGDDGQVILIPNTVAIIKGTPRRELAQKLVDFLLSSEAELMLAKSKARQIPLGPVELAELPEELRQLRKWSQPAYPLAGVQAAREQCLDWLRAEYGP